MRRRRAFALVAAALSIIFSLRGSCEKIPMRLSDTWLAVLFIALATLMFGFTLSFPPFPGQKYGPDLFPRILCAGIVICAALMIFRDRQRRNEGAREPALAFDPAFRQPARLASFLLVPGAIIAYLLFSDWLGFIPTSFLLLLGLTLWFKVRAPMAVAVAVAMTGLLQWFFGSLMRVPLPRGLFMQLLYGG